MNAQNLYRILAAAYGEGIVDHAPMSYSGRAMYGARCIAVSVGNIAGMVKLSNWAGRTYGEECVDMFEGMRNDSMGRGLVFYWPNMTWDETTMLEGA